MATELETQVESKPRLDSPIILVGCVRSGSTLLRLMLDHHPELTFMFESEYMVDQIGEDGSMPAIQDFGSYLENHRIFKLSELDLVDAEDPKSLVHNFVHQRAAAFPEVSQIGLTIHHDFDRVPYVWPEARYIHLIRDGRDVSRSVIQMGWAGNNWYGIDRWLDAERAWQRLKPKLKPEQYIEVKYEELVADGDAELSRICDFLGISFTEAMYDYRHASKYGKPDPSLAEQWRRKQSPSEVQIAEAKGGEMLESLGYAFSEFPRIKVGPGKAMYLRLHNWWIRARFRMKRYGLALFFADYFARRIGTTSMKQTTRMRTQAVDNANLR